MSTDAIGIDAFKPSSASNSAEIALPEPSRSTIRGKIDLRETLKPIEFTKIRPPRALKPVESTRNAPTPQAKGKVEREHQFWQHRLPAYFASEQITDLDTANSHITDQRRHRNEHETHRELRMSAHQAWDTARRQSRCVLRPVRACAWWPYVWSQRTEIKVGPDGRVPVGAQRLRVQAAPGVKVILCPATTPAAITPG